MDNVFDKVFNQAAAAVGTMNEELDVGQEAVCQERSQAAELPTLRTDATGSNAIKRILLAAKDKDYFRMMQLPLPEADALGRPTWSVSAAEVSKAYRKQSILVHPDKNPGEEARAAFEALKEAHNRLKDPGQLEGILMDHLPAAKARRVEAEAKAFAEATVEERIGMNSRKKTEAKLLRKAEGEAFQAAILQQMREKQEEFKRKRGLTSRYTRLDSDEEGKLLPEDDSGSDDASKAKKAGAAEKDGSDSEDDVKRRRQALAKRKKQRRPSVM